jgi:hypothetical protein
LVERSKVAAWPRDFSVHLVKRAFHHHFYIRIRILETQNTYPSKAYPTISITIPPKNTMAPTNPSENTPHPYQRHIDAYRRAASRAKRVKHQHSSSPEPSTVSDDSALVPTVVPEETTDASDMNSDMSSEVSESSEEPSEDDSSEGDSDMEDVEEEEEEEDGKEEEVQDVEEDGDGEEVVNLRANRGQKPVMKMEGDEVEDIRPFLKNFLPKLKAANEELEVQKRAGTLETAELEEGEGRDDAEEQYIELVSSWLPLVSTVGGKNASRLLFALQG